MSLRDIRKRPRKQDWHSVSRTIVLALLAAASAPGAAVPLEDPRRIEAEVESFVRDHTAHLPGKVEIELGRLETVAQLPPCNRLEPFLPPGRRLWGKSIVGIKCQDTAGWSVQVPVTVRVIAPVVTTARPLARRQVLSAADLARHTLDMTQLPLGLLTEFDQALGKRTVAALAAGTPLRGDMLTAPAAVSQGETVRLVYSGNSFRITGEARALSDAALGEKVQVRTASGKVLRGVAVEKGVVQVQ